MKRDQPAGHIDFGRFGRYRHSYQVLRSEFDAILLDHARECGTSVRERTAVASVQFEGGRPVAAITRSADGSVGKVTFDYIVDATGQSGLLSAKYFKNRHEEVAFANVAVGSYFGGARPYRDDHGIERPGAFSMEALTDGSGWTWAIPLHDGTLSVGVVVHRDVYKTRRRAGQTPEQYFARTLDLSPDVSSLISATPREADIRTWRDYSYFAASFAGPGYRLAGDAAGFIDPLFSTGVHLAFLGALSSAATICSVLRGELAERAAERFHERFLRQSYTRLMITVAGFYRQIRDQKTLVLPSISRENFQLAFDLIQPIVSGNADVQADEIDPDLLARAVKYTTDIMLEVHGFDSNNRLAGLLCTRMMDESINRLGAVDAMFIRLERGRLGVERLGKIGAALAGAKTNIVRGAIALAG